MEAGARSRYVHAAVLQPTVSTDVVPADVGAWVTVALCGDWEHEGPCRWPNNHLTSPGADLWDYRVVFVSPPSEEAKVRERVEEALRRDVRWTVITSGPRDLLPEERELAERLAATPIRNDAAR